MNMHIMAQAATISSTDTGGNWNSAVSWVGGIIPGAADDVVIVSTATITVSADANARTLDVFGTIVTDDNVTLTIQGNVIIESFADLCLSGNTSCGGSITLTDINDQSIGTMELPLAIKYGESSRKDQWLNSF